MHNEIANRADTDSLIADGRAEVAKQLKTWSIEAYYTALDLLIVKGQKAKAQADKKKKSNGGNN